MSNEHFTLDGTLLEAWASKNRFQPKDADDSDNTNGPNRNPTVNFLGKMSTNDTHGSTTDLDTTFTKKQKANK